MTYGLVLSRFVMVWRRWISAAVVEAVGWKANWSEKLRWKKQKGRVDVIGYNNALKDPGVMEIGQKSTGTRGVEILEKAGIEADFHCRGRELRRISRSMLH